MRRNMIVNRIAYVFLVTALAAIWSCSDSPDLNEPPFGDATGDVAPPQQINDAKLSWNGHLTLTWSAPWDDSQSEPVSHYEIRFSDAFFDSTGFWENATRIETICQPTCQSPPTPGAPGSLGQFDFPEIGRKKINVAIRSRDESGNLSQVSNIGSFSPPGYTFTGTCVDVMNPATHIQNLQVNATVLNPPYPMRQVALTSDSNGSFVVNDIPEGGSIVLAISDGQSGHNFHDIAASYVATADQTKIFTMVEIDNSLSDPHLASNYGNLFNLAFQLYKCSGYKPQGSLILKRWQSLPIDIYIKDSFDPITYDIKGNIEQAIVLWNNAWQSQFGSDLFHVVYSSDIPSTGIYFSVGGITPPNRASATGVLKTADDHWVRFRINIGTAEVVSALDIAHELGHTLPWGHFPPNAGYQNHLMDPNTGQLAIDDIRAAALLYRIPDGTDLSIYGDLVLSPGCGL